MKSVFRRWWPRTVGEAFAQFTPFVLALAFSIWWRRLPTEGLWFSNLDKIPLSLATTTAVLAGFSTIPLGVLVTAARRDPFPEAQLAVRFLSRGATTALAASAYSIGMYPAGAMGLFTGRLNSVVGVPLIADGGQPSVFCQIWVLLVAWAFLNFFRAIWTLRWLGERAMDS